MDINESLKIEIDELDKRIGLSDLLRKWGFLYVAGSYIYDLMAWRDFDLVLKVDELNNSNVYEIVSDIGKKISPDELRVIRNTERKESDRPRGYWIGIYIDLWKIDLWEMDHQNAQKELEKNEKIKSLVKDTDKSVLIALKKQLTKDPDYHRKFSSVDVYYSYIYGNVRTTEGFYKWLKEKI